MRKKSGCSMADIASALNISPSTVSRALRSNPSISSSMTTKVLAEAQKQGYVCSKEKNIAIVLPNSPLSNYDTYMLNALCTQCNNNDISWEIINCKNLAVIKERLIHGIISLNYHDLYSLTLTSNFNLPLIAINCSPNAMDKVYSISSDDENGIFQVLQHLKKLGHNKIIYLYSVNRNNYCSLNRFEAFEKISKDMNLKFRSFTISINPNNGDSISAIVKEQIEDNFTAGIIEGETLGFLASSLLQRNGIKIPDDFSLVTWSVPDFSEYLFPSMTALRQNFSELANISIKTLLSLWNGEKVPILTKVPYLFFERESTKVLENLKTKQEK